FDDPAIYIRLGSVLLVKKRWKHAREAFLRSIQSQPTAEAWSGVAYAEYRSEELNTSYEALCEANVLDNERADVWAQLCLVHLRFENWDTADHCCRQCLSHQPECEELLLEAASEYSRRERQMSLAEACARRALQLRDSGQGHSVLADVLAQDGQAEESVLEAQIALKMLPDQPDLRKIAASFISSKKRLEAEYPRFRVSLRRLTLGGRAPLSYSGGHVSPPANYDMAQTVRAVLFSMLLLAAFDQVASQITQFGFYRCRREILASTPTHQDIAGRLCGLKTVLAQLQSLPCRSAEDSSSRQAEQGLGLSQADIETQLRTQELCPEFAGRPSDVALEVFGTNAMQAVQIQVLQSVLAAEAALNHGGVGEGQPTFTGAEMPRAQRRLAIVPRRLTEDESPEAAAVGGRMGLELRLRTTDSLPPAGKGEIKIARTTNIGKLAGAIANRIREDGAASVRGVGAVALRHAVKATAIASGYLAERDELGTGFELAALAKLGDKVTGLRFGVQYVWMSGKRNAPIARKHEFRWTAQFRVPYRAFLDAIFKGSAGPWRQPEDPSTFAIILSPAQRRLDWSFVLSVEPLRSRLRELSGSGAMPSVILQPQGWDSPKYLIMVVMDPAPGKCYSSAAVLCGGATIAEVISALPKALP
ncbi:unnamed protein product, partial [Polarella glacialis]